MSVQLRVGIAGCGLIGAKRAAALGDDTLAACYDMEPSAANALAREYGAKSETTLEGLLSRNLDVAIIATWHDHLAQIAVAALEAGSHVLVEKPAGIGVSDIDRVAAAAERSGRLVKVGFNHRFAPGIDRAITEARSGRFGDVMFARARYGHGGRPGYEQEWRLKPEISGGGELVDQGMHVIDLFNCLLGPLPLHSALLRSQFWDAPVEDNAVLTFADPTDAATPWATAHVTWTEWKNLFSLEIYCRTAKLQVEGLAGSYGPQRLTIYSMRPEMGPPGTEVIDFHSNDVSWEREWQHFRDALTSDDGRNLCGDLSAARYAWVTVEEAYRLAEAHKNGEVDA